MSKCSVVFNADESKWFCPNRKKGDAHSVESHYCDYNKCPGRSLTEDEETDRLLEIESRIEKTQSKGPKKDPIEALIRRMKRELERIENEEKNLHKCDFKLDDNNKWFCKKNMDSALSLDYKECYRDDCPGRKSTYEEDVEESNKKKNVAKELKELEKKVKSVKAPEITPPTIPIIPTIPVKLEPSILPVTLDPVTSEESNLKKCEWHICPNYFVFGKKERFCCEKCRKKDAKLRWRRKVALKKKGLNTE